MMNSIITSAISLILDDYSEEIAGWHVSTTHDTDGPMKALEMALMLIEGKDNVNLIHHSDLGCQYASREYVSTLNEYRIRISMTESGDPMDNAQTERVNNTMINELLNDKVFNDIQEVIETVAIAVDLFNNSRLNMSIGMITPAQAAEAT